MIDETERSRDGRTTDTRHRIQQVALELFGTKGASNTSLRDIANALGITKAALYYHFPSKADLIRSIYQPFMDQTDALLDAAEARRLGPREVFEAYIDGMVGFREAYLTLLRDASVLAHVDLEPATVRWVERFERLLVGPAATPEQQVRAIVAIGGVGRTIVIPGIDEEPLRSAAVEAALAALGTERAPAAGDAIEGVDPRAAGTSRRPPAPGSPARHSKEATG